MNETDYTTKHGIQKHYGEGVEEDDLRDPERHREMPKTLDELLQAAEESAVVEELFDELDRKAGICGCVTNHEMKEEDHD